MKFFRTAQKPLRRVKFRIILASHTMSKVGSEFSLIAVSFAVITQGGTASDLGLVLMARTLPPLFFLLAGGVWADRLPRARLMISADTASFITQTILGLVLLIGYLNIPLLMILQAVLGSCGAFFRPAAAGLIPEVISSDEVQPANSLLSIVDNMSSLLGPVLAGILITMIDPAWLILIDALTFLSSSLILIPLWNVGVRSDKLSERSSFLNEAYEGVTYVMRTRWIRVTVLEALLFQSGFAIFFTLGPVLENEYSNGSAIWGILVTAFGAGSLLGGILALSIQPKIPILWMQMTLLATIPLLFVMALRASAPILAALTVLTGAGFSFGQTLWETYIQRSTPPEKLGRVAASAGLGASFLRPFGYLVAGVAADTFGVTQTFIICGVVLTTCVIVALIRLLPIRDELKISTKFLKEENI